MRLKYCKFQLSQILEIPYFGGEYNRWCLTGPCTNASLTGPYTNARLTEIMHIAPLMNLYTFENGTVSHETVLTDEGIEKSKEGGGER